MLRMYVQGGIDYEKQIYGDLWAINVMDLLMNYKQIPYHPEGLSAASLSSSS